MLKSQNHRLVHTSGSHATSYPLRGNGVGDKGIHAMLYGLSRKVYNTHEHAHVHITHTQTAYANATADAPAHPHACTYTLYTIM